MKILVGHSKKLRFQSVENGDLLKNLIQGSDIIYYEFKRPPPARKGIKVGRTVESIALVQRRGDEAGGKGDRGESNRHCRAGINTFPCFREVLH